MAKAQTHSMIEQINHLSQIMKQEADILALCLDSLAYQNVPEKENLHQLIEASMSKIEQELKSAETLMKNLSYQVQGPSEQTCYQFDLLKIRINKILLLNERIFTCNQQFKDIISRISRVHQPRLQDEEIFIKKQNSQQIDTIQENQFTLGINNIKNPRYSQAQTSQNKSMRNSQLAQKKYVETKTIKEPEKQSVRISPSPSRVDLQQIKLQINEIYTSIQDLHKKVETHQHYEYSEGLSNLREENARLFAECNLLKNDNTELLHSCNQLKLKLQEFSNENSRLEGEIEQIKNLINKAFQSKIVLNDKSQQQESESINNEDKSIRQGWFLIPSYQSLNFQNESENTADWVRKRLRQEQQE